jgi:hypothetical protein
MKFYLSSVISVGLLVGGVAGYFFIAKENSEQITSPTTCVDESEGVPVITSIVPLFGPVGTKIEISGCNFNGFEGDKNIWIENSAGVKGILYGERDKYGERDNDSKTIKTTLMSPLCQTDVSYKDGPCSHVFDLTSGKYKIYTMPWGKKSNEVNFEVIESKIIESTQEEISNLRTYRNEKYGFEFKYPVSWRLIKELNPFGPFQKVLNEFSLDSSTIDFIGHAIALYTNNDFLNESSLPIINKLKLYIDSFKVYENSQLLYPMYGLSGISEGLLRVSAIYGNEIKLRSDCIEILTNENGKFIGIKSEDGEVYLNI